MWNLTGLINALFNWLPKPKSKVLSKKKQIEVLEYAKEEVLNNNFTLHPFLCVRITNAICTLILNDPNAYATIGDDKETFIQQYIPLFSRENAEQFGADQDLNHICWWTIYEREKRADYLDWMMNKNR